MLKRFKVAALASLLAFGGATVQAQDFDGAYVGGAIGAGTASFRFPGTETQPNARGPFGSVFAGWGATNGNMYYGVEGDLSLGRLRGSDECTNPDWTCRTRIDSFGSVRGRFGVVQGNSMFFGTVGFAAARIRMQTELVDRFTDTNTVPGVVLGVGMEHQVGATGAIRAELMHHRFRGRTWDLDIPYTNGRTRMTTARIGYLMRF